MSGDITQTYDKWLLSGKQEDLSATVKSLEPVVRSEVARFSGDKDLLNSKAKILTIGAIKSYDPFGKTKLSSWVITNLQPLNRYGRNTSLSTKTSELAYYQNAEMLNKQREYEIENGKQPSDEELADMMGISVQRIGKIKSMVAPKVNSSTFDSKGSDDNLSAPGIDTESDSQLHSAISDVYHSMSPIDQQIYDLSVGANGAKVTSNLDIAKRLRISASAVTQRKKALADRIIRVYR